MSYQPDIVIQVSQPADVPQVARFLEPFVAAQQILRRTPQQIASLFENGFLATVDGKLVGCAAVEVYSQKMAEIQCLAVDEEYRRRGVGSSLVRACIERARQRRVRELMAITAADQLFQSCGFEYALPGQKRALFIQFSDDQTSIPGQP
jgi:N-acetylglutamate synthase-like GNAT family acetyltransferase